MKYLFFFCLLATGKLLFGQEKFTLTGKVKGLTGGFIHLNYAKGDGQIVNDSFAIKTGGGFSFTGNISEPSICYLYYSKAGRMNDEDEVNFFLEPASMNIQLVKGKFKQAVISGSKTQQVYQQLEKQKKTIYAKLKEISAEIRKEKDKEKASAISDKMVPYIRQLDSIDYKFFAATPSSYVTAYMLRFHVADFSWQGLEAYYTKLGTDVQGSRYGRYIKEQIEKLKTGSPGLVANDFSKADINGRMISLSEFKGKDFVLLDFWASWCIPCRKANPHLRQIYAKYRNKGLEIIGVSDDDGQEEKWKKAVEQDSLSWRQVLRGRDKEKERNENDLHEKFGIHDLPTRILIDRNGIIVGRYDEDDKELDKKLKEIFGDE